VTMNDSDAEQTGVDDEAGAPFGPDSPNQPDRNLASIARAVGRRIARQRHIGKIAAVAALAALLGAGYVLGGPPADNHLLNSDLQRQAALAGYGYSNGAVQNLQPAPAATAAPAAAPAELGLDQTGSLVGGGSGKTTVLAAGQSPVIVKTGQMNLEVADIDKAIAAAQSVVSAAGGNVSSSNRSGSDQYASASITYRIPVARWDATLAALRKVGSKVLTEQTGASDVTMQVVDLNARIDNLQKTEAALQSIMARASSVPDVLAVETQLSQTQGQIEELTAQRDNVNDQAAMSTLSVTFSLPGPTVTTQATQDWTLGSQVDQAAAALVRIGQGIVTLVVWAVIVVVPVGIGLLILLVLFMIARRIGRRGNRTEAPAA
jgi:hypothetical protein